MAEGYNGSGLNNRNANENKNSVCNFIPGKEIQHCLLSWGIENFQTIPEDGDKYITSPCFILDSISTMWSMRFYPHKKVDLLTRMKFCLCRHENAGGPELIQVSYRFGLMNEDQNVWFVGKENVTFNSGTEDSIFTDESTYEEHRDVLKNNIVTVVCEMYLSVQKNKSEFFLKNLSHEFFDLLRLSVDMRYLMKRDSLSDVTLSVNRNIFHLHKCILSARSSHFANLVDWKPVINLPSTDVPHIDIIINYMYSGNFTYSIQNNAINFGLYECSEKYGVNGLTQLLAPKCIALKSIIVEKTFLFTWNIKKFNDLALRRDECLISSPFGLSPNSRIWYIDIYPKGTTSHPKFISVLIRSSQAIEAVRIYTTLSLLNEKADVLFKQHGETPLLTKTTFGFMEFIRTDMLNGGNNFLNNGKLIIKCSISLFIPDSYYEGSSVCLESNYQEYPCFQRLSKDMAMLLERKTFSDKSLFAAGRMFRVHKAILSTRYPTFLCNLNTTDEIGIPDISPAILDEIIYYGYTAKLQDISIQSIANLHDVARNYNLSILLSRCKKYLLRA